VGQLTPWQPRALWAGHLLLHRVEALVALTRPCRVDEFIHLVLQALTHGDTLAALEERLHLEGPLLRQVLRQLEAEGLAHPEPGPRWVPTALARQALDQGSYLQVRSERRVFYFVEGDPPAPPPHFLHLDNPNCDPWPAAEDWGFDARLLEACVRRPPEWKHRHSFPADVQGVLGLEAASRPESWERVILDRPERLAAALVVTSVKEGSDRLLGFAVRQEGWVLQAEEPVFVLDAGWQEVFPNLAGEPPPDVWRQAWRAWCQPRNLPAAEVEACTLQRQEHRLRVAAPPRFFERLRATRSDALKGEAWLLADTGRLRSAALVEVVEVGSRPSAVGPRPP
jgi:hypothetical protein